MGGDTTPCQLYLVFGRLPPLVLLPPPRSLAALWLTAILNVLWESPCSLAAQRPSVEASVPGSVCQSAAPIQLNLLPQLSAFLPEQTPHCHPGLHASPLHLPCVNEGASGSFASEAGGGRGESPINQYTPLSLWDATVTPLCFVLWPCMLLCVCVCWSGWWLLGFVMY